MEHTFYFAGQLWIRIRREEARRGGKQERPTLDEQEWELIQKAVAQPADGEVYYRSCAEAKVAGAAPLRVGDPGYGRHPDRDGDGVACES